MRAEVLSDPTPCGRHRVLIHGCLAQGEAWCPTPPGSSVSDTPSRNRHGLSDEVSLPYRRGRSICVMRAEVLSDPTPCGRHRVLSHGCLAQGEAPVAQDPRSEEHTSELQSRPHLVCRLLLEKKKKDV